MKITQAHFLILAALVNSGCSSMVKKSAGPSKVSIEFTGRNGETSESRYFSNARTLSFEGPQLLRDRTEAVDFTVETKVTEFDTQSKILKFETKTTHKDGTVDLHDLAFPELNERIDFVLRSNGQVLKAGKFSPQSIFYVPSLPIPDHAVEVGDTWTMTHTWFSARNGIPLKLDVVGILKNIVVCEKNKYCADLEVSGSVGLGVIPDVAGSRFESRIWGRVLFSLERGDVIWSDMRSHEEMGANGEKMVVTSCMVSEMKTTADYRTQFTCEPKEAAVVHVPTL